MLDNQKYKNQYIKSCPLSNKKKTSGIWKEKKGCERSNELGLWVHNTCTIKQDC
jgi:hypothetical protein